MTEIHFRITNTLSIQLFKITNTLSILLFRITNTLFIDINFYKNTPNYFICISINKLTDYTDAEICQVLIPYTNTAECIISLQKTIFR